ncbi:hypothetical protein DCC62_27220, partial [candidate division KSB1 bacterium]
FTRAEASNTTRVAGRGTGSVQVEVVNSALVPDNHTFELRFRTLFADSIRANVFDLVDLTSDDTLFTNGYDLEGAGSGLVGTGLLPVVSTPNTVSVDSASGFTASSLTNGRLKMAYRNPLPINLKRPGFPEDMTITFSDVPIDTSLRGFGLLRSRPTKFRVTAHTADGDLRMKFYFLDKDNDGTLSLPFPDEFIDVVTYLPNNPIAYETWRVELDTTGQAQRGTLKAPTLGDVYEMKLIYPFENGEVYSFTTTGEFINPAAAQSLAAQEPYVVPNPYVGLASFEAERFAISGRGERRMEFRNLPQNCTIRIFTVRGELVQALHHDGSDFGMVPWDLRSKDNLEIAPGLYLYHVDAGPLGKHIGKFAIIK